MATADELLYASSSDVLVIDSSLRTIKVPASVTNIGVEADDEVTKLQFRMPRYYNDFDLSEFIVRINYVNANGDGDIYDATDVEAGEDTLTFSWLVGRFAVMYKGNVKFIVCLKKLDSEGVVDQEFNTTVCSLPVLVGLEIDEAAIVESYPDAIAAAAYEAVLLGLENGLKGDPGYTPVKGVDYFTNAEINEAIEIVAKGTNGLYANAYKKTVEGEVIRVDDVSPVEHTLGVNVRGKNLFHSDVDQAGVMTAGISYNILEGSSSIVLTGVTTEESALQLPDSFSLSKGTYTASVLGLNSSSDSVDRVYLRDQTKDEVIINHIISNTPKTFTLEEDAQIRTYIVFKANSTYDNQTVSIQIEEGDTATEYEPYIDPTTVTVTGCGKNIVDISKVLLNYTYSGGGGVGSTISITRSSGFAVLQRIPVQPNTSYTFSLDNSVYWLDRMCEMDGADLLTYHHAFYARSEDNAVYAFTTQANTKYLVVRLKNKNDETVTIEDLQGINLQFEIGDEATEYEPYKGGTYTPNADGSVDVKSVAPFMQIFTDTPGVTLDCEYNKDIQKVAGINVNRYEFSIQQLEDIYAKYKVGNNPISMVRCELNSLPALRITYRLYTATISGGVVTKLFDIPVKYNPNANTTLYEQVIPNASEFKCGFVKISDTWMDFNSIIDSGVYDRSFHQMVECHSWINSSGAHGIAHSQTISFDTTGKRDEVATQINALISATTNVAWEHTPINKIIITPKYLGE